jgi:hypothetical protein
MEDYVWWIVVSGLLCLAYIVGWCRGCSFYHGRTHYLCGCGRRILGERSREPYDS